MGEDLRLLGTGNLPGMMALTRNATGHLLSATGYMPQLLLLLAQRFNFKLQWVPTTITTVDDTSKGRGLISHMLDGEADIVVGGLIETIERQQRVGLTMPIFYEPGHILIPYPATNVDSRALSKPFEPEVWNWLLGSLICVVAAWLLISHITAFLGRRGVIPLREKPQSNIYTPIAFSLTVLLCQGDYFPVKSLTIRLIASFWCLGAAVLVPAYSGNLLSHIISPEQKPVIETVFDIPSVPYLKVAVNMGQGVDVFLQKEAALKLNTTYGKVVEVMMKRIYRCEKPADCLAKVLRGDYIYIHGLTALNNYMIEDLATTGKCHFTLALQSSYSDAHLIWALPKTSLMFDRINKGILELDAYGLTKYWKDRMMARPSKCLDIVKTVQRMNLNLKQMAITFFILVGGYAVCSFVLFLEHSVRRFRGRIDIYH